MNRLNYLGGGGGGLCFVQIENRDMSSKVTSRTSKWAGGGCHITAWPLVDTETDSRSYSAFCGGLRHSICCETQLRNGWCHSGEEKTYAEAVTSQSTP